MLIGLNLDEFRRCFDLSQSPKLEYIRFDFLWQELASGSNDRMQCTIITLESLPKYGANITISLRFIRCWEEGHYATHRIDQILATKETITYVEIIPTSIGEKEVIAKEFPLLVAKNVLWISTISEAKPVFTSW